MARDHILMYVLVGIVLINIIAILLMNNRLADQEAKAEEEAKLAAAARNARNAAASASDGASGAAGSPSADPSNDAAGTPDAPRNVIRTQPLVRTVVIPAPASCTDCYDIEQYVVALNDTINMEVERVAPEAFPFTPSRLPAILFNQSLESYADLIINWTNVGNITTVPSGPAAKGYAGTWYVLPTMNPPYYDTTSRAAKGIVTVTYLSTKDCSECYDPKTLRGYFDASNIVVGKEYAYDIGSPEGRAIVAKYNITRVPTVIADAELGRYPSILPGWLVVGTIESDGTHVMRNLERMQLTYYDITSRRLMKP